MTLEEENPQSISYIPTTPSFETDGVPGSGCPARLEPLRFLHFGRGRAACREPRRRVLPAQPELRPPHHPGFDGRVRLEALKARRFDLVITMTRLGGMDAIRFGREVKERYPDLPIVLLADTPFEANHVKAQNQPRCLDSIFIWQGDVALFLAIIKFVEDRRNVERDSRLAGVRIILLVENSVRFYSTYLPLLYTELMKQTQALIGGRRQHTTEAPPHESADEDLLAETSRRGGSCSGSTPLDPRCDLGRPLFARRCLRSRAGLEFVRMVKKRIRTCRRSSSPPTRA